MFRLRRLDLELFDFSSTHVSSFPYMDIELIILCIPIWWLQETPHVGATLWTHVTINIFGSFGSTSEASNKTQGQSRS